MHNTPVKSIFSLQRKKNISQPSIPERFRINYTPADSKKPHAQLESKQGKFRADIAQAVARMHKSAR